MISEISTVQCSVVGSTAARSDGVTEVLLRIADVSKDRASFIFKGQLIFKDDGTTIFRNVWNHSHKKVSHPRSQDSQNLFLLATNCRLRAGVGTCTCVGFEGNWENVIVG